MKFFLFSSLCFTVLVRAAIITNNTITFTYKDVNDCPDVGPETLKAFLTYYANCAYEDLSPPKRELSLHATTSDVDIEAAQEDYNNNNEKNQREHRRLQTCSNCPGYCNCLPASNCAVLYGIGCRIKCNCNRRRNLIDNTDISWDEESEIFSLQPGTFMETLDQNTFQEKIIKVEGSKLEREVLKSKQENDLWTCACDALKANGIGGRLFLPKQTENMCTCQKQAVDVWTNA